MFGLVFQRAENPIADGTRRKLKLRKRVLPRLGDLDVLRKVETEIRYARWFAGELDEPSGENVLLVLPSGRSPQKRQNFADMFNALNHYTSGLIAANIYGVGAFVYS